MNNNNLKQKEVNEKNNLFPIEALPGGTPLQLVTLVAAQNYNIPVGRTALSALCAISAVAGKGLQGECGGRTVRSNIMTFIMAPSGDRKSASSEDIWSPIYEYTTHQNKLFRNRGRAIGMEFEQKNSAIKKRLAPDQKKDPPSPAELCELEELEIRSRRPEYLLDDSTTPALLRAMYYNNGCITVASTDAVKLMANIAGEMNQGRVDDSLYLKGFSGDYIAHNRVTDNLQITIADPWLSMYACFTDATLKNLLGNKMLQRDGFLPRFLPWFEGSRQARSRVENLDRPRRIPNEVRDPWREMLMSCMQQHRDFWLRDVPGRTDRWRGIIADAQPHVVDMNDRGVVRQFAEHGDRYDIHGDRVDETLKSYAVRREEYAQRIALLLHMAQYGVQSHKVRMNEWTAWAGCEIDSACYRQWRGLLAEQVERELKQEAETWRERVAQFAGGPGAGVSIRDLYTKYGKRQGEMLAILNRHPEVFEVFRGEAGVQGGRPSNLVRVKPAGLGGQPSWINGAGMPQMAFQEGGVAHVS